MIIDEVCLGSENDICSLQFGAPYQQILRTKYAQRITIVTGGPLI